MRNTATQELEDWANNKIIDTVTDGKKMIQAQLKTRKDKADKFPLEAFPPFCKSMMKAYQACFGASPDHYGLSILTIAGAVLGNAAWAVERGNTHPPLFYSVIVDKPGRGKTPIIREVLRPIIKIEQKYREEHAKLLRQHREDNADNKNPTPSPPSKEMILNDFTLESIYKVLRANPRGLLVFRDEIAGWINSMNAYKNSGSDEQAWLEIYNCGLVKVNRQKSDRPLFISRCFVGVIGTTQPAILQQFAEGNKAYNGFLARILFSYPEDTVKVAYNKQVPNQELREKWATIIDRLYSLPMEMSSADDDLEDAKIEPTLIGLSEAAETLYREYYDNIANLVNESDDEIEQAVLTKFDSHVLRLALVLHFLNWAETEATDFPITMEELAAMKISEQAMAGAIRLANYFRGSVLKVVGRLASPVEQLAENYQVWYNALPEEFDRGVAVTLGKEAQMTERTIGRKLNDTTLFKRIRQGVYLKNFV
ncbi:DUF3987 domain-containing protein [Haliscomenobacter hydrossis]|uniref:DUF3987 domain-containing protein n=1 Tax=Haliscomenobacter hydrossis (strain ATCC 27775 / DSM 1100 / LMG 10767 / O) TaxID=760192 RepID=F4L082_HALH1|nr:DUF3987 domain-containing protein [Haliscomenobacter hydrossis]AEE53755.1 hypothetical protein Halhy_5932 [Haliscomenobacter hydrossis DSM 1100]